MKLYIWAEPYPVRYGTSMAMAVAESLDEAKAMLANSASSYSFGQYESGGVYGVTLGEPTRVVDLPCAEWHMWSE